MKSRAVVALLSFFTLSAAGSIGAAADFPTAENMSMRGEISLSAAPAL